jgi:hypothetical protein
VVRLSVKRLSSVLLDVQPKIQPPAGCITGYIGADTPIEGSNATLYPYILQGEPYLFSNPSGRRRSCNLKFDLEKIKRMHTEYGCSSGTNTCYCMVERRAPKVTELG